MLQDPADPSSAALRQAAQRFTHALAQEAMLDRTARLEALVHAGGADPVFQLDQALVAAWPDAAGRAPSREVIWATEGTAPTALRLSAFDSEGRVLLQRSYGKHGDA